MTTHKFAVGQQVEFRPAATDVNIPRGLYTIVRRLPVEGNTCQYRIRNVRDGHERVVVEAKLLPAPARPVAAAPA